jgi:hypothetical protein
VVAEGVLRVHSITENPPQFGYEAVVPLAEDEPGFEGLGSVDLSPIFEVRSIRTSGAGIGWRQRAQFPPAIGVVTGIDEVPDSGDIDFVIDTPGVGMRIGRASQEISEFLTPYTLVQDPQKLRRLKRFRLSKRWVEFEEDPTQEPWEESIWLPVARIHRPKFRGCQSTYSATEVTSTGYDAQFDFGPAAIGGDSEFSVTLSKDLPATRTCKEAAIKATLTVLFGRTLVDGEVVSEGTRVVVDDVQPKVFQYRDIEPHDDQCGWARREIPPDRVTADKNLLRATGKEGDAPTERFGIATKASGRVGLTLGFNASGVPLRVSVAYKRSCEHRCEISTRTMPGAHYLGYQPELGNPLEQCWTVLTPRAPAKRTDAGSRVPRRR